MSDDLAAHIAATLNEHDIDDYVDELDNGEIEQGIYCIKCGWKGTTQREANRHLAEMIDADMGFELEAITYVETETKSHSGGEGVLRHGGQITRVLDYNRTDVRWVSQGDVRVGSYQ